MDPSSAGNSVFDNALSALLTPLGMAAVIVGVFVAVIALISRGSCWVLLALALWISTFAMGPGDPTYGAHYLAPLQAIGTNGRLLATGAFLCLLLPSLLAPRGWRGRIIAGAAVAFLALELLFSSRMMLAGLMTRALSSIGIYLLIFIVLARGVGTWLQEPEDAIAAFRAIALGGMILVATNAIQLILDSSAAIWAGRFHGTSGNAQLMARDLAAFLPAILFLMLRKEEGKLYRLCLAGTLGLLLVMIAMTGSRTGAMMVLVALVVMFRRALGRFLKFAVVGCVVTFLAVLAFPDAAIQADRFTSTVDTRSGTWGILVSEFFSSPLIGHVSGEPDIRESSYLSVAARMGIIGMIPLLAMILLAFRALLNLGRARPMLGEYASLADAVTASMVSLAVGAITEGYVLGTLTLQVFLIYLNLALIAFLVGLVARGPRIEQIDQDYDIAPFQEIPHEAFHF